MTALIILSCFQFQNNRQGGKNTDTDKDGFHPLPDTIQVANPTEVGFAQAQSLTWPYLFPHRDGASLKHLFSHVQTISKRTKSERPPRPTAVSVSTGLFRLGRRW